MYLSRKLLVKTFLLSYLTILYETFFWHCDEIGIRVSLKKKILWVRLPSMLPAMGLFMYRLTDSVI